MNDLVRMAQVTSGASAPAKVKIVKPSDGTAQVIQVAPGIVLDLQDLASQNVVMVHAGDRLIILFPDSSAVVLKGFFGPDGQPIAGLDVDLGRGAPIPAIQLASLLPISDDQNLLPAAGPASAGNAPNSALQVPSVAPDSLGDGRGPLDLLAGDNGAGTGGTNGFSAFSDTGRPNTPAVIGGQAVGTAKEDDILSVTGVLTVTDPDAGQAGVVEQPKTIGLYGTFSITAEGTWTYVLDNALTEVQALGEGKTLTESFTVTSTDGTATQIVTITIKGANDVPVLGGEAEGSTVEDSTLSTSGTLTIADVDTGESHFIAQSDVQGLYGKFTVDAAGNWTFVLDNDSVQSLGAERSVTDSFIVTSADGSASQTVAVTIYGTNDVPVLGGETTGTTQEDTTLTASGVLTIADVDTGESQFVARSGITGLYGAFSVDADGNWTYTLNNGSTAVQQLGANSHVSESFTVWSADLSASQTVVVTIDGTNDVPVISGASTGSVKEDTTYDVTGILIIADADLGESSFVPQSVNGTYGSFSINAGGFWIYTLNNNSDAVQSLGANSHPIETFTVWSSDGSASQTVAFTVNGKNDVPTLYGVTGGHTVSEDNILSVGNNLYIIDRDTGEASYEAQTNAAGTYGTFSIDTNGHWVYTLNNNSAAVQSLPANSNPTETFKVWSADHSASIDVTVTVRGANDVPTLGGTFTGAVIEDKTNVATGNLTISDPDTGQSSFIARSNVSGTYGTFSVTAAGAWTYTLNNALTATQKLGANSHPTETFSVVSADGAASTTVTITVNGTNDAPAGADKTLTTLEDSAYKFLTSDFGFSDAEGDTLQGMKITQLPGNGSLTLNGVAVTANQIVSASDIASGLLLFTPAANGNGTAYANFKFAVQDNGGTANSGQDTDQSPNTITLNVTGVSDAPSGTDATIQAYEDTAYTFKVSDFGFTDTDGNSLTGVKITQLPGAGTLTLNGVAVTAGQTVSMSNIQTGLLKFTAGANASGNSYATIQFAVQDNGGTANGGVDVDPTPNTLTLNVGAVNDAPAGADKTVTTLEDTAYTFQASDFGFADSDGGSFQGVKITQLPGAGSLTLNGTGVTANQVISASDVPSGLLVFTPAANGNGGAYATFRFAVKDDGGTANGGQEFDTTPNTITMSVTSVNDAPILDATKSPAMSIAEDAATPANGTPGTKVSDIVDRVIDGAGPDNFTDVDSFVAGMAVVGVNTSAGTLYYSVNSGASWIAVNPVSATSSLLLRPEYLLYFKPAANYSGTIADAITFRAWDVSSGTPTTYVNTTTNGGSTSYSAATDTIAVTVTGTNDTPVAQAKSVSVSEDGTLTAQTVTATDPDSDPLTYAIVGSAPTGLIFNADGTWAYAPPASYQALDSGENGTVIFQYKANDGTVDSNTATVTITITGANDAPVAQDKAASVSEDGTLAGQVVTATDIDVEALTYAIVGATPAGLTFNTTNGTWSYVPPAAMQALDDTESATVTFQYKANDGTVDSNVATVTITVNGANDAPIAQNRSATVFEDDVLTGPAALATDADVESLTYAIFGTTPAGLAFNADGTWTYTPPASFQNMDDNETQQVTFQYVANDGTVNSAPATVTITVKGANDAPVAQNGSASVSEDSSLTGQTVTATDIDVEGLSYAIFGTAPAGLTFNANGTWSYIPPSSYQSLNSGQTAEVTFQYKANDGTVDSAPATVTITINGANETPVAQNAAAAVSEDGTLTAQQVTASDGSSTPLTYQSVGTLPSGLTFNADGTWAYTPPAAYQSLDDSETATVTFQYKASNGAVESNTATVTITVQGANDKPVAQSDAVSVSEDGAIVGRNFTATDVDVENLTYAIVGTAPAGLTLNGNGTWNYTPPAATYQSLDDTETATVIFQYKANDGTADSDPKTVTITITGANDAPVAQNNSVSVSEDGALTGKSVIATDADIETLTYALTAPALDGLTFNTDGTWSYTPPASYQSLATGQSATISFQYNAYDGTAYSNTATQTIVIQGANDAPVARPDTGAMLENQGTTEFNVRGNDTLDPDSGAPNTITTGPVTVYAGGSYGLDANDVSVVATADGLQVSLIGTDWDKLARNNTITMTVNYTLVGDQGLNGSNQLTLTVTGVNDAPVLDATKTPTLTVDEDAPAPTSGVGTAISNFIDLVGGGGLDNVTDVDNTVTGIAITGVNTAAGTWYYSATGTGWTTITAVSDTNALLLTPDFRLYFRPNADYSGTIEDALTFRAWDRSIGTPGQYGDATTNGGSSAFSSATDTIRVVVNGDNDPAVISGATTGNVTEDATPNTVTGDLNSTDPDGTNDSWQAVTAATATTSGWGTYTIDATGHWAYTLNNSNATVDALPTGGQLTDSFTVRTEDGTSQVVTVTITGANDAAVISGSTAGTVAEDATPNTATGALTVTDPDTGQAVFAAQNATAGTYGTFSINAAGAWTYTLNNANATVDALKPSEHLMETFTVASADGTAMQQVQITINGTNDAPVLTRTNGISASGSEDSNFDNLLSSFMNPGSPVDPDGGAIGVAITKTDASHGTWYWSADHSVWTAIETNVSDSHALLLNTNYFVRFVPFADYNGNIPQALIFRAWDHTSGTAGTYADASVNGGSTAFSSETKPVSFNISPLNDPAVISGTTSGAVTEDATPNTATGDLNSTDVDGTADAWQTVATATATASNYGTYTLDATGHWVYTLNNANPTVNGLAAAATLTDTFTARTADGTSQIVTVTITGTNDAPTIGGTTTRTVTEDGTLTATGTLTISDVDTGESSFRPQSNIAGLYGTFSLSANGTWNYALNNSLPVIQALPGGAQLFDTFTAVSFDGSSQQQVQVNITGLNDVPTATGVRLGTVKEDTTLTATGKRDIIDVDTGESAFVPHVATTGTYGTFSLNSDGTWNYVLNNGSVAVQSLSEGQTANDTFFAYAVDLSGFTVINITVQGTNDVAIISGTTTGAITEDAAPNTATGDLNSTDVDGTADAWQAVTAATATANGYGTYTIDATGHWVFALDNANPTVNGLAAGATLTDTFTAKTADGTTQVVTVTITGATDATTVITAGNLALGIGGFKIIGQNAEDMAGISVASAGDINNDGYADIMVGAYGNSSGGIGTGAAYVIYGKAAAFTAIDLDDVAAGNGGFKIDGEGVNDWAGRSVASAGDLNGDGYDDMIVGASNQQGKGAAYVVYGRETPFGAINLDDVALGTGGFKISGEFNADQFGTSVASAGDINGDGFDDIIVGASSNFAGGTNAGAAYVIYGKAAPITSVNMADVTAGNGGFKITGERSGDYAGLDVSSAGDVNGDGYADLIVGAYNNDGNGTDSGAAYIVFGKASAISAINLDNIAVGQGGFKIIAESAYDYVGFSVAAAGDLNGDGIDDVVVGAHAAYGDNTSFGAAYVVYGTATGPSSINLSNIALGNGGFRILGETGNGAFGYNVASAGDVNGDGYLDLIVGGLMTDGSSKAYVVYGSGNTITSLDMDNVALGQGSFSIVGLNAFDYFGTNASSAGDLNGDGFDDLIIGAKNDNAGGSQAGAAYIVYGGQNLPNNAASHIAGTAAGTVTEDGTATVGGALTVTQANQLAGTFAAANLTGSYGSFAVLANGTWTYTLNNGNSTVNALNNGQHLTEKFNVLSADGTATETVTVTINGHTDPVVTVSVTEDVTHVFTATDFAQTAGGFQGVTVDPMSNAAGKLMLGNVAFASATFVTAAQIAAGMLTWAPADNVYGTAGDAEIAFRVRDNAGVDSATSQATALDMSATNYFDDTASMSLYQIPMTGANQSYVRNGTAPTFSLQSSGAQLSSFELLRSDNNLEISWSALDGNGRTLTLLNHFDGGSSAFNAFSPLAFTVDGYSIGGSSYNLATGPTAPDGSRYAIAGSAASETLSGNSGLDLLFGGGGDDIVNGGAGNDYLSGGAGNDTLTGGDGIDSMIGGDGDDTFIYTHTAGTVAEIYDGGTGYDTLVGSTGNTTRLNFSAIRDVEAFTMPSGGSDGETLYLTAAQWAGFGSISMGGGSDTMVTIMSGDMDVSAMGIASISGVGMREFHDTTGNDMLTITGAQFDALVSNGYMTLNQGGNDTLYLTSTSAVLNSIADNTSLTGLETISGEKATSSINISLQAGQTEAVKVTGSAFDDTLGGGSGNDTINGGDGHDTITGGNGNDFLLGDIGADILTGGTGADTFAYTATSQGGDTVKDFMSDDMIGIFRDLLGVTDTGALQSDGTTVAGNTVLFESVGSASAAAQNNSAKLIYDSTNHDLYYDSDGGASSSARILLAHLEAGTLDASHIMLMA